MRTEQEMMKLILDIAKSDTRIRAVYMNGSRTNPNVPCDIFQDYDIVYVVNETESFQRDKEWINCFGERLYMQCPEEMDLLLGEHPDIKNMYGWLIQLADGNRLDLHVETIEHAKTAILEDKLCQILLDKDGILPDIPTATEEDYYVEKPTKEEFRAISNEFWWCLNNVAKGLWRKEISYVQDMLHYHIRPQLIKLLSWKIGYENAWSVSVGKSAKYMYQYLSEEEWKSFLKTYASYQVEEIWNSVIIMCHLFDTTAKEVSKSLEYPYNREEALASYQYLLHVRQLPEDAKEIF